MGPAAARLAKCAKPVCPKLAFPFSEYRAGQRELAVAVYKTILTEQRLFVEAPTGTGKTISTLFPSIKAIGEAKMERIFYLTAKQSTQHVAEEALELMAEGGLKLKSITLTAKDKIIFQKRWGLIRKIIPTCWGTMIA